MAALAGVFASAGLAQVSVDTVDALAAAGARKLSEDDIRQLHGGGVTVRGVTRLGAPYSQLHRPDGSVSGSIRNLNGEDGIHGHWHVDDAGKQCIAVKFTNGGELDACFYVWTIGGRYFAASTDVPGTPVRSIQYVK